VLAYYMSYDNDLTHCGPVILDALKRGVEGTSLAVTVLVDDAFGDRLVRHVFTSGRHRKKALATDDSTSSAVVEDYLSGVVEELPAERYAVVFLNHGGRVDEMCLDEQPGRGRGPGWLSASGVGDVLRRVRTRMPGRFELLFLQQCARASVDNLYNMRDTAAWVMGSQVKVGAPNTYYEPVLRWLDRHPSSSGLALGRQVMRHDRHYRTYVCVDGRRIAELPDQLSRVADRLIGRSRRSLLFPRRPQPCFEYAGERNYDLLELLGAAFRRNRRSLEGFKTFDEWVRTELIRDITVHPSSRRADGGLCGLSVFAPSSGAQRRTYDSYPLHRASSMSSLWKAFGR
jgi:cysteine peptidase C11 family protein